MAAMEQQQRAGAITQLEFHQAMRDFKTMFPEMDDDVIEMVLRSNNGAVDATIDQLLAMNADSEIEKVREPLVPISGGDEVPPVYSPPTPPPSYQQAVPYDEHSVDEKPNFGKRANGHLVPHKFPCASANVYTPSTESLRSKFNWQPMLGPLPPSFLRVEAPMQPGTVRKVPNMPLERRGSDVISSALLQQKMEENERQRRISKDNIDPGTSQYLEDERIAIFLQNEEFVQELRHNQDFMSTLELDGTARDSGLPDGPSVPGAQDPDAAFKETLKKMGKVSRKKFSQLATMFSRRKKGSFQQLLTGHREHGVNPSRDNLLLNNGDEYGALENEGSDEERRHRSWDSHGGEDGHASSAALRSPRH